MLNKTTRYNHHPSNVQKFQNLAAPIIGKDVWGREIPCAPIGSISRYQHLEINLASSRKDD